MLYMSVYKLHDAPCASCIVTKSSMRKDDISESMIQALYYYFVASYIQNRMYSTVLLGLKFGFTLIHT